MQALRSLSRVDTSSITPSRAASVTSDPFFLSCLRNESRAFCEVTILESSSSVRLRYLFSRNPLSLTTGSWLSVILSMDSGERNTPFLASLSLRFAFRSMASMSASVAPSKTGHATLIPRRSAA